MTTRKRPMTAHEDLAEAKRRAKSAKTPIAKIVTQQVVEKKERTYSGQAAREIAAQTPKGARSAAVSPKRAVSARKAAPKRK
jgi:hypothetical protein